ncbi:unnamed protein product, partial [marine sediment metagenome]
MGLQAGAYLEITDVYPPPEAEEGDWVFVPVYVRNKHTADVVAKLRATIDGITVESYPATLKAGTDYSWGVHFTMPNKSVSGTVALERRELPQWFVEDTATIRQIALKEPEEPEVPPEAPLSRRAIPAIIALGIVGGVLALIFI